MPLDEVFFQRLLGGKRAFPMEDSGGVWGYFRACELLAIPKEELDALAEEDPEELACIQERLELLGDWDPEAFDLARLKDRFDR